MFKMLKNKRGMTLVEIMIVLAIIGGLVALLAPRFMGQQQKANAQQAKIEIGQIMSALNLYFTDCGSYPETLNALVEAPGDDQCPNWGPEPYLKSAPIDPWNNAYVYEVNGSKFNIISLGADRREGGSGYDKDIDSEDI